MAIKFHRGNKADEVKLHGDSHIPISDEAIGSMKPLPFELKMSNPYLLREKEELISLLDNDKISKKRKKQINKRLRDIDKHLRLLEDHPLIIHIKQLTMKEYQNLYHHIVTLKAIINTDTSRHNVMEKFIISSLPSIIASLTECVNPEMIVDEIIIYLYNALYLENISRKDLRLLFEEVLKLDTNKIPNALLIHKGTGRVRRWFDFHTKVYRDFRKSSIDYIRSLAKTVIDNAVREQLTNLTFDKLIWLSKKVLEYNDVPQKKSLQF